MKKKYIIVLIVLIPALFFIISFIYKEKVHQEYVKNCYKNNKQYMESIVDYFEKYKYDSIPMIIYSQDDHIIEKCLGKNSEYIDCGEETFDKYFTYMRNKYQKDSPYNVFSFIRVNYDNQGNMLMYFIVKNRKIENDKIRNYYLVYIDNEYNAHGSDLAIDNSTIKSKPFSGNWYLWSKDVLNG